MTSAVGSTADDAVIRVALDGWAAQLDLGFRVRGKRTVLHRRCHRGPLLVQRPFYPPGDSACHVCLMHPPGGLVGGDRLRIRAELSEGAHALITGPAATKVYRTAGAAVHQNVALRLCDGAFLEWLPPDTLFFDGAYAASTTRVDLEGDAVFLGWEVTCFGRPASGERFRTGRVRSHLELRLGGQPVWIDRGEFPGLHDSDFLDAPYGLQGSPVVGTLVAFATGWDTRRAVEALRAVVSASGGYGRIGISGLDSLVVCRYLGDGTRAALETFRSVRTILLPMLAGRPAIDPRLWNT